jgi:DNA-binding beta-propeller fold protein YncE
MFHFRFLLLAASLIFIGACAPMRPLHPAPQAESPPGTLPGRMPDGSVLLPNQWYLRSSGRQVELGDFPVNIAVHPGGRFAAILHSGHAAHEVRVIDLQTEKEVDKASLPGAFYGIEFDMAGGNLFCSGGPDEVIHAFDFRAGALENHRTIRLRKVSERGVPSGLAVSRSGTKIFAANVWGHRVTAAHTTGEPRPLDILLGTNLPRKGAFAGQDNRDADEFAAEKRAEAALEETSPGDTFPYACRLDEKRRRLYVSLWAKSAVAVIDLDGKHPPALWQTQDHPCEMILTRSGKFLFVANANQNTVSVFDADSSRRVETIWAALFPHSPPGSTPTSLALSPDEKTLFVANSCNNVIAVFDVSRPGRSRSLGFIPAGWYPTSVRVTPDGKHLLVANGKGLISKANPGGPQPGLRNRRESIDQYIGRLFKGTLSIIDLAERRDFPAQLAAFTAEAYRCSPLRADNGVSASRPADNPIPLRPGAPSPLKYCIYVVKENRTYDQVFGDMPEGNGDASLCLFPEEVTPNHHKLAREFVLLDNFYVESEVSADGHEWSMGAYATDFVEKMWPLSYGHNASGKFPFPAEGNFEIAYPAGGYLWDRAKEAGVSYRSYGEFVANGKTPNDPGRSRVKTLQDHFDPYYRGFDLGYRDVKRAERFISELQRFEKEGQMPQLQIVRLPNDHTRGVGRDTFTPRAFVADNDVALGMLVEAVSRSKFWGQTAIFVVEDDAQNGPDHVDAHRTVAFVISPYTKRKFVDSTLYSTSSMLRTMELILGLKPMSQFDAAARPMFHSFQSQPDLAPFTALPARVDLQEMNTAGAWGADIKFNFAREDAADDLLLNEVVWRSVRGAGSIMPAPVRAGFVFQTAGEGDED